MRQDKALKILSDNIEDIKREFGVKSIGVFPWRESPVCGCDCDCDCCGPRAKEIGVAVKYMPGVSVGFEFFGLELHIEELLGCGILLTHIDGSYPPEWRATIDARLKDVVYAGS